MLPEKVYIDNEAPESDGDTKSCDTIEEKRDYLRSLIMELTDEECSTLWEKWRMTHV